MHHLKYQWSIKPFESLTPTELYQILRLRSEVFVVEQNCVFLDMDNKDQFSVHLMGYHGDHLVASSRLIAPGKVYKEMSIGRVVSSPAFRRSGAGRELMQVSIKKCYELFGEGPIKIGAQLYLKKFYESLGFVQSGDVYDEDGIDHIEMIKQS
jgi:ElaA protein